MTLTAGRATAGGSRVRVQVVIHWPCAPGTGPVRDTTFTQTMPVMALGIETRTVAQAPNDPNNARTRIGVGEEVELTLIPGGPRLPVPRAQWAVPGGAGAGSITGGDNPGHRITFSAPRRAPAGDTTSVTATVGTLVCTVTFTIVEPATATAQRIADFYTANPRWAGQGMRLTVTINPTDVSFSRVTLHEHRVRPTNRVGYFVRNDPPIHEPFDQAFVRQDNTIVDRCAFWGCPPPWAGGRGDRAWVGGTYAWNIPLDWRVGRRDTPWQLLQRNPQVMEIIDANGGSRVSKFNQTSGTRHPTPQ